jgi:hypothetical protein
MFYFFLLEDLLGDGALKGFVVGGDEVDDFGVGSEVLCTVSSGISAIETNTELQEFLEDVGEVSSCSEHDAIVTTAINVFPMNSSLEKQLHDMKIPFKAGPMQRVGPHLLR